MQSITAAIKAVDWPAVARTVDEQGYAVAPQILSVDLCRALVRRYAEEKIYRKTVDMARYRFGRGEYKYYAYPLPDPIETLRHEVYPHLAPIANAWMAKLGQETRFPGTMAGIQDWCRDHGQTRPTPLILKYGPGGYNTLHQDLYGEAYFPLQAAFLLSDPDTEFTGGEFVMTEQIPRAQSRAIVLTPGQGDMVLFTTRFRPVKGTRGYYRAAMRHGVSALRHGERFTLGIIFHDAAA